VTPAATTSAPTPVTAAPAADAAGEKSVSTPPKPRVSAAAVAAQYSASVPTDAPDATAPDSAAASENAPVQKAPVQKTATAPRKKKSPARPQATPTAAPDAAAPATEAVAPEPEAAEPEAIVVGTDAPEPDVAEPDVAETELAQPELAEPELAEPESTEPELAEPESDVAEPDAEHPTPAQTVLTEVAAETDVPAVRLRGVAKSFGETRAVDAIDLSIPAGTFYGVVGPNGAGKTTTLSMIAGLLRPDRGTIEIAGIDLAAEPARAKRMMGILPDRLRTFDRLTGRQLLHYYGVLRGLAPAVVESRAADLARAFDLAGDLGRTVADYSAGMTKKVMLAGAMIHSPRVLVLDEPFEAVDPVSSAIILDILKAYVAHGGTVILSSHGMDLVERVCSGVAVVVAGQVLAEGTVEEVRGELTLEQRFIELAGGLSDVEGLEWLHTFSG